MNRRIISSIILGGVCMLIQPAVMAKGSPCMKISAEPPYEGADCSINFSHPVSCFVGTDCFVNAVQFAAGEVSSANQSGCQGARVVIEFDPQPILNCVLHQ